MIAGSIWAKASWGHWWVWSEPTLVSYLIVILLFCTYQPLRFSIEDPERQARYAAVFAVVCGAFVPINFIVVRLSAAYVHPRVLNLEGGSAARFDEAHLLRLPARDRAAVRDPDEVRDGRQGDAHRDPPPAAQAARRGRGRAARQDGVALMIALFAEAPALPLHTAGPYVAAAYIVFLLIILIYVAIMAVG